MTTEFLLDILEETKTTATFFTLGPVFKWYPKLLKDIKSRGHEIAFHSCSHNKLNGEALYSEIMESKQFIDQYEIIGYRAPVMDMSLDNIASLVSANFVYDSSIYGSFNKSMRFNNLLEIPVSTYPVRKNVFPNNFMHALKNFEFPVGSGLFMGIMNDRIIETFISKINQENLPFVSFIHPWQLAKLPDVKFVGTNVVNYFYLANLSAKKLSSILKKYTFASIREALKEWK